MTVLVVGRYPPPSSPEARGTMSFVRELARGGAEVAVLAQPYSAASIRARLDGPAGAWRVWRLRRRYEEIYVIIDAVLRHPAGRFARYTRIIDCLMWALVLRSSARLRVVVIDPDAVPGSIGGRTGRVLWSSATRMIVGNDFMKQRLVDQGAADPTRIEVREARPRVTQPIADDDWAAAADASTAVALIRQRAARDRRAAE